MTIQATTRNIRRSFTLAPEALAFVKESRQRLGAASNSQALELLLREKKTWPSNGNGRRGLDRT
jgi:FMN phosphatase YigB (HAD superfamily)